MTVKEKDKILIAYFSRKGNNYVGGSIVDLPVGNTEVVAKMIRERTGGDLFKIEPVREYAKDYHACTAEAQKEQQADARPAISDLPASVGAYGTIILGYPNWWGTMPMPVWTFLEKTGFSGKKILPFCTHEGSRLGRSENDIKKLCPGADIKPGLAIRGGDAASAEKDVVAWLSKNGLPKRE